MCVFRHACEPPGGAQPGARRHNKLKTQTHQNATDRGRLRRGRFRRPTSPRTSSLLWSFFISARGLRCKGAIKCRLSYQNLTYKEFLRSVKLTLMISGGFCWHLCRCDHACRLVGSTGTPAMQMQKYIVLVYSAVRATYRAMSCVAAPPAPLPIVKAFIV